MPSSGGSAPTEPPSGRLRRTSRSRRWNALCDSWSLTCAAGQSTDGLCTEAWPCAAASGAEGFRTQAAGSSGCCRLLVLSVFMVPYGGVERIWVRSLRCHQQRHSLAWLAGTTSRAHHSTCTQAHMYAGVTTHVYGRCTAHLRFTALLFKRRNFIAQLINLECPRR